MLKSCFGIPLRASGLIIGWIVIVGSVISIITCIRILSKVEADECHNQMDLSTRYFQLVVSLLYLLISAVLVVGIQRNHHLMLIPWLVLEVIGINFYIFVIVLLLINENAFRFILNSLPMLVLQCYIFCAIYSLYKNIRTIRKQQLCITNPTVGQEELKLTKNPINTFYDIRMM